MTEIVHGVYSGEGDNWTLELKFDTDSVEFLRGFQCGMTWELLDYGLEEVETVIIPENVEMAIRIAESRGYTFNAEDMLPNGFDSVDYIRVIFKKIKKRKILHPDKEN